MVCLVQGVETVPDPKTTAREKISKKIYNYHSNDCFDYPPVMFENIKHLGFNPMHKEIRVVENVAHMCEHKYAKTHHYDIYCGDLYIKNKTRDTRAEAVALAHTHFKNQFKIQLGVKYFVPDPIHGGNSNTGPQIATILENHVISAAIFEISPELLLSVKKCCDRLTSTRFVRIKEYDLHARTAFNLIMCELGSFGNLSANSHAVFCHGGLYMKYAQEELGVSLGALSGKDSEQ